MLDNDSCEIELKFLFHPEDASRLGQFLPIRSRQRGRATTRRLNAVYFDTPKRDLLRRHMALRVRKEGGGYVQCLKAPDGKGGFVSRHQWENPVPSPFPDFNSFGEKEKIAPLLPAGIERSLEAVFETRIRRTSRSCHFPDGTEISLDLDRGEIIAEENRTALCELELELVSGSLDSLFGFAIEIAERFPLRLSAISKAERGYGLLSKPKPGWRTAAKLRLARDSTVETAMSEMARNSLEHFLGNEACALAASHTEGVHQMRVAVRRLRSMLSTYRPLLPKDQYSRLNRILKRIMESLGPARDWDVFLHETLKPVEKWGGEKETMATLRGAAQKEHAKSYDKMREFIGSREHTIGLLRIQSWLLCQKWRDQRLSERAAFYFSSARTYAGRVLAKHHQSLLATGRKIKKMKEEDFHKLRIAVKKTRYASEIFHSLYPAGKTRPYLSALSRLQTELGIVNDLATARNLLDRLLRGTRGENRVALSRGAGMVVGWHARPLKQRLKNAAVQWEAFEALTPFWRNGKG